MTSAPRVSIIIDNYNYGRFVGAAIDSALAQTYPHVEVIVVDDGSTDESRQVIEGYGSRIIPILKANGGQASAFNTGFAASRGEAVIFLDADDVLLPSAAEEAMMRLSDEKVVKVQWPMRLTGPTGREDLGLFPGGTLPDGDQREDVLRVGPTNHLCAPTSGNAWSRRFIEQVFPVPEKLYRTDCDTYLFECAPFFGEIRTIPTPQSLYRRHGMNGRPSVPPETRVQRELAYYDQYSSFLAEHCRSIGRPVDLDAWKQNSWWHKHQRVIEHILALGPTDMPFILIDDTCLEPGPIAGRRPIPFTERDGHYAGPPTDDAAAIAELKRLRDTFSASHIVIAWPAFWWREQYPGFHEHLYDNMARRMSDDTAIIFELRPEHPQ